MSCPTCGRAPSERFPVLNPIWPGCPDPIHDLADRLVEEHAAGRRESEAERDNQRLRETGTALINSAILDADFYEKLDAFRKALRAPRSLEGTDER